MNRQLSENVTDEWQLREKANNIFYTADFMTKMARDDNVLKQFEGDVFDFLSEYFAALQLLKNLGVNVSQEPAEYEILLQYLCLLIGSKKPYSWETAMDSNRVRTPSILNRIANSRVAARELLKMHAGNKENDK